MSERIIGSYDDALYKSTYTLLYFTLLVVMMTMMREYIPHPTQAASPELRFVYTGCGALW